MMEVLVNHLKEGQLRRFREQQVLGSRFPR
jgi:hypothetical protein